MFTNYFLKVLKLAIIIVNASYFAGMFWLIFCELTLFFSKEEAFLEISKIYEVKPLFDPKLQCKNSYKLVGSEIG